jgi:hypothetical protein
LSILLPQFSKLKFYYTLITLSYYIFYKLILSILLNDWVFSLIIISK